MATLGTSTVTMLDFKRRLDENDKIAGLIELLAESNEMIQDMVWLEGNLPTGHKTTIRTGLPTPTWRLLNYGVQPTKGTTAQVTDACGMLEAYAEVDKDLADLNGNAPAWRLSEDAAHIEGMNQSFLDTLIYGDTTVNPERFVGLNPRFATPSATTTNSGYNMITGAGSDSDNTSIWLVVWGPNTVHGIYPKGSQMGLKMEDKGQVTLTDAAGGRYEGYRTHYQWKCGLCVRDWRYVVRMCNIDVSALVAESSDADLVKGMVKMLERLPSETVGTPAFYVNRTVQTMLRIQALQKSGYTTTFDDVAGKPVLRFQGIPVRRCDAIITAEATVAGTFGTP